MYDSYGKKCNTRFLLNYGFINLNNDANEYPLLAKMEDDDKYAAQKTEMLGGAQVSRVFRIQVNFTEPIMEKFISFMRFCLFDENIALLYQIKGQWLQRRKQQNPMDSDEDEPHMQFLGDEVPAMSKRNERLVWAKIKELSMIGLSLIHI